MTSNIRDWPHLKSEKIIRDRAAKLSSAHLDMLAKLVDIRVETGMTQSDVAGIMGVSQQRISALEQYDADPKLSTIRRYANAVGALIDIDTEADDAPTDDPAADFGWTSVQVQLAPTFSPIRSGHTRGGSWSDMTSLAAESKRTDFALVA